MCPKFKYVSTLNLGRYREHQHFKVPHIHMSAPYKLCTPGCQARGLFSCFLNECVKSGFTLHNLLYFVTLDPQHLAKCKESNNQSSITESCQIWIIRRSFSSTLHIDLRAFQSGRKSSSADLRLGSVSNSAQPPPPPSCSGWILDLDGS